MWAGQDTSSRDCVPDLAQTRVAPRQSEPMLSHPVRRAEGSPNFGGGKMSDRVWNWWRCSKRTPAPPIAKRPACSYGCGFERVVQAAHPSEGALRCIYIGNQDNDTESP